MAEIADLRVVTQIAQGYVSLSDQFLTENLGRPYNIQEIAQFSESATAALLASAYVNFREHLGKDAAEAWLKKTLSTAAAAVRLMGADALIRFEVHIKDMPNKLHQRGPAPKPEAQPAPAPEPAACACKIGADGSCPICIPILSNAFRGSFQYMRHMADAGKKMQTLCRGCQASQTDRALATVVPEAMTIDVLEEHRDAFNLEIMAALHQVAGSHGVTAIPITEKAWKDAAKK